MGCDLDRVRVKHVPGSCTNNKLALDFNTKVSLLYLKSFLSWTSASYSAHTQSALFIFNVVVSMF